MKRKLMIVGAALLLPLSVLAVVVRDTGSSFATIVSSITGQAGQELVIKANNTSTAGPGVVIDTAVAFQSQYPFTIKSGTVPLVTMNSAGALNASDYTLYSGSGMRSAGTMTAFTASGTFTAASNSASSTVYHYRICGGGGGGGGSDFAAAAGGGGGAGAYAEGYFTGLAANGTMAVTIGAAGTAGTTAGTTGGSGGNTVLASPASVTAGGGAGGVGATSVTATAGGAGGTITGSPTISFAGAAGGPAYPSLHGGFGAGSPWGPGGMPAGPYNGAGGAAGAKCAGGGGGFDVTAAGGAGAAGYVVITRVTP